MKEKDFTTNLFNRELIPFSIYFILLNRFMKRIAFHGVIN